MNQPIFEKTERNRNLRELATEIAGQVGQHLREWNVLVKAWTPRCRRITRSRGHGHAGRDFSVPRWAAQNTDYFIYYVIHESLHCFYFDHGSRMMEMERRVMAKFGLTPEFQNNGRGPYVDALYAGDKQVFKKDW
jgi:hypothetical protein